MSHSKKKSSPEQSMPSEMARDLPRKVLVTGANGYIGSAVARSFSRSDWTTYGLVRRPESQLALAAAEIQPLLGAPADLTFVDDSLDELRDLDVLVSVTEQIMDYVPHFNEILAMCRRLAKLSGDNGKRLLVMFTSGCKDYGETGLHGNVNLRAHTEDDALNAPSFAQNRANYSATIFKHAAKDGYDAVLLRPTPVHGFSSSLYGGTIELAAQAARTGTPLILSADSRTIIHNLHVDDCGDGYRALAEHPDRAAVAGQAFNLSGRRYETLEDLANAFVHEFQIESGTIFKPELQDQGDFTIRYGYGFSQWVGSEKVRRLTGWSDKRPLFAEGMKRYRLAFEAAKDSNDPIAVRSAEKLKRIV